PAARATTAPPTFAAAWEQLADPGWRVGLLSVAQGTVTATRTLDVPTRAHGLLWEPASVAPATPASLLAVARRPGDWMVRWSPATGATQWAWIEPDRAFNGHVIASGDGRLFTTETDLATGAGLVGVRDAISLEKLSEWRTGGMDPHELLLDADGSLLVANGGIPTLPESGRLKIGLDRMDASLARLDTTSGALRGQWRLEDRRLSLRHIAWSTDGGHRVLGIALQAEHDDAARKREAPVLALFDGSALRLADAPRPLSGYGGDIAFAGGRFAVSCPRADGVALFDAAGRWQGLAPLAEACSLAAADGTIWAGGRDAAQALRNPPTPADRLQGVRLDNHWLAL
ncbi:MAG: DUF1513 domain-containing protein, partial [Comamonadaceae bacterium]